MKEEEFLELVEKTREEIKERRMAVLKVSVPSIWREFLEGIAKDTPEERFKELLQQTKVAMAETREETIQNWNENLEGIFSLIRKGFEKPIKPKEIEKQVLVLIDLLKEAAHYIIEELNAIDVMEAEFDRVTKK